MNQTAEATAQSEDFIEDSDDRLAAANKIARLHMYISLSCGVIPVPVLDLLALSTVQMNMIRKISALYDVTFRERLAKNIITTLVSSSAPIGMGSIIAKAIPVVNMIAMPVMTGASTYALGKVIIQHMESGGTFLDFDPEAVREHYKKELDAGRSKAKAKA
jgi:uncharacterized protein (DUF697 family)